MSNYELADWLDNLADELYDGGATEGDRDNLKEAARRLRVFNDLFGSVDLAVTYAKEVMP